MLSQATIDNYIEDIPPIPEVVKNCIDAINEGDLIRAADEATEDRALTHYLQLIVNKPIFGFRNEVKDTRQVFGILGLYKARQIIYSYYILLLLPKEWRVFDFDSSKFQDFQARMIHHWSAIVEEMNSEDKELADAITIVPATLVVCEMLFRDIYDTVRLLRERKQMSYEKILIKITGRTLFEIASFIAKKWDFEQNIVDIIHNIPNKEKKTSQALEYMRLLLVYEMSRPMMIQSGLSEMFEFNFDFEDELSLNFYKIIENSKA